jgi:hypothetical protein
MALGWNWKIFTLQEWWCWRRERHLLFWLHQYCLSLLRFPSVSLSTTLFQLYLYPPSRTHHSQRFSLSLSHSSLSLSFFFFFFFFFLYISLIYGFLCNIQGLKHREIAWNHRRFHCHILQEKKKKKKKKI